MVEYGLLTALSGVIGQFSTYATTTGGPSVSFATNLLTSIEAVLQGIFNLVSGYLSA